MKRIVNVEELPFSSCGMRDRKVYQPKDFALCDEPKGHFPRFAKGRLSPRHTPPRGCQSQGGTQA